MSPEASYAAFVGVVAGLLYIGSTLLSKSGPKLPPGPRVLPVLGNVHQFPKEKEWLTYAKWAETYGGIMSLKAFGKVMIIISSQKIAADLLDKRSGIYSDRPVLPMLTEHMGWKNTLGLSPYGERFKEYRRLLHRFMGTRVSIEGFAPLQERETHNLLRRILRDPKKIQDHIRQNAGAIILMMTYGYRIQEENDPFIDIVDKATEQFAQASTPGAFLVDTLPILQYVPDWFPGTAWKKTAIRWRQTLFDMADLPFDYAKRTMESGTAVSSYTTSLLQAKTDVTPEEENAIKWTAGSLYGGGADTSVSTVYSFFLAMTLYPEIQKKAQAEIDAVIGSERLPRLSDRGSLPYVEAIVLELLRWQPVTPLGVPHRVTEDNEYDGYHIPKHSIVMVNAWQMLHDPQTYKNPMEFNPSRFHVRDGKSAEQDPHEIAFGFGRRICPGVHVADASIFLSVCNVLAVFDISKVKEGSFDIEPVVDYTSGGISHPRPFECTVTPRCPRAEDLINASE